MKTIEKEDKSESQNNSQNYNLIAIVIFVIAAFSVIAYNRTYSKYFSEIIQLPARYSVPTILVFLPIILSITTFIVFISTQMITKENNRDNQSNNDENPKEVNILKTKIKNKNNKWKTTFWVLLILTIFTLITTQIYLYIVIYVLL